MPLTIAFAIALTAGLAIVALSLATIARPDFQFWPPPDAGSWQHITFRWLFRIYFLATIAVSVIAFGEQSTWRLLIGLPLLVTGFGLAVYWTRFLGWRNAFGEARGLATGGIYQWSRNPIYVVSIVGMVGWAIVVNSWWVTPLLVLWAVFYIIAPFLEEPWMQRQYGEQYDAYRSRVRRFF